MGLKMLATFPMARVNAALDQRNRACARPMSPVSFRPLVPEIPSTVPLADTAAQRPQAALRHLLRWLPHAAVTAWFLFSVAQFYDTRTGFTSLIGIGEELAAGFVPAMQKTEYFALENSAGYDGQYYAQIALHPTLNEPALTSAIDNLPYRARRILLPWTAWVLGLGQPEWILQAFALQNVIAWLLLGWLLLRWLPPDHWQNTLRWALIMLSPGLMLSVRLSLTDGPSLLLIACGAALVESGRRWAGAAVMGVAGLTKETSVLAVSALAPTDWRRRPAVSALLHGLAVAAPLAVWMIILRVMLGPTGQTGWNNFSLPLSGWWEKWAVSLTEVWAEGWRSPAMWSLLMVFALTVQAGYLLARPRLGNLWWRIGAMFALLMLVVSTPVWEGYPGAACRVLLPVTLAFVLLVPRSRFGVVLLLIGSINVANTPDVMRSPIFDALSIEDRTGILKTGTDFDVGWSGGWYQKERHGKGVWRWSSGDSGLVIQNRTPGPLTIQIEARMRSVAPRVVKVSVAGQETHSVNLVESARPVLIGPIMVPPGKTLIRFHSTEEPQRESPGETTRWLSFALFKPLIHVVDVSPVAAPTPAAP